ncbi:MAG: hypothetical protein GVY29_07255 [Spirochaetes bacterium]|nr:hypothetical protein [Spirochaetota bacterium]
MEIHIGILTAIMIGVPLIAQLGFAGYLHGRPWKKPFLMMGIHVRVAALAGAAITFTASQRAGTATVIGLIYLWMLLFSMSGAFAGISYTDIVGRAVPSPRRRQFFVMKQTPAALGVLAAALLGRVILAGLSYPADYRMMFLSAAAALLVATAGFWILKEPIRGAGSGNARPPYWDIMRSIPEILRSDQTLRNYILASNLLGLGVTLVPFYAALGRNRAGLTTGDVGTLLLVQIVAMVVSNVLWSKVAARWGFKGVVRWLIFLLPGSAHSADHIARDAVLIEITTDENRALYSGIFGTLNLTRAVFPVASGALLATLGYNAIFTAVGLASLLALPLLRGMVCPVDG